jgi:hypothetical protein
MAKKKRNAFDLVLRQQVARKLMAEVKRATEHKKGDGFVL